MNGGKTCRFGLQRSKRHPHRREIYRRTNYEVIQHAPIPPADSETDDTMHIDPRLVFNLD
jgi:hypothetical protein